MKSEIVERLMKLAPKCPYAGRNDEEVWKHTCEAFAEKLADNAVVVYGRFDDSLTCGGWQDFSTNKFSNKTHTAILLDVQPIKPVDPLAQALREYAEVLKGDVLVRTLLKAADKLEGKS